MTDTPTEPGSGAGWPLMLLLLVPILYVASTGPVVWLVRTSGIGPGSIAGRIISIIYWPIAFLAENVALFEDVLRWYVELFYS